MKWGKVIDFPKIPFKYLLAVGAILICAIAVLAAGPSIDGWVIGPGGGNLDGDGINLYSAVGQPVGGTVSNDITLCSGLICGPGDSTADAYFNYLPMILNNH